MTDRQREELAVLDAKDQLTEEEELFAAVRLISKHCSLRGDDCSDCPLLHWCEINDAVGLSAVPDEWPDPEEGGD